MFQIGKNFHIIHMTDDLGALDAWYDDVFAVERFMDHQFSDILKRYGSLVLIGDLCVEPMAPSFDVAGWEEVAIGRFWRRFGRAWHSIAWYTEDPGDIAELYDQLVADGVRIYSGTGVRSQEEMPTGALFTHPHDTITQLEFIGPPRPGSPLRDPRFGLDFDPSPWAMDHPLHVLKSSHTTLVVADLAQARDVYVKTLGGTLIHEGQMALQRTHSAFVSVGTDLVIELAQPLDDTSPMSAALAMLGPSLYSVSLRVRDLGEAETYLMSKGFRFATRDDHFLFSDPDSSQGVVFGFTTWDVPGDFRPGWG
ncbi:MAG TPA: VOC family protein [Acidimicrobiales bacterium]|jgi:catechol 2,3-dioxygenase-like lactoylglutathione lyase family enzyme|nr:VOC family protein [Acidimicrobiales bacterium]